MIVVVVVVVVVVLLLVLQSIWLCLACVDIIFFTIISTPISNTSRYSFSEEEEEEEEEEDGVAIDRFT